LIALGYKGLEPLLNALTFRPDSLWLRLGAHHILTDVYSSQVHESESSYLPLYYLPTEMREAVRPVLIAIESTDHSVLMPPTARKAQEVNKGLKKLNNNPGF
jgi:hypothetical protein